ncbi:MAG: hypothetical protein ACI4SB_10110 [Acutalibacteraceae bacterium]
MKQIKVFPDKIVIKGHYSYLVGGVILLPGGIVFLKEVVSLPVSGADLFTPGGLPVLCLAAFALFFFFTGLFMLFRFFETVTVDENGIVRKRFLTRKRLRWDETADFGVFYDVKSRRPMYVLYFSDEKLPTNQKETRKKLRGRTIKIYIAQSEFDTVTETLMPFCRRFAGCEPFVSDPDCPWRMR